MGTVLLVIISIVVGFGLIGFLFSKDGEREDAAKAGAMLGGGFVVSLLPTVIAIVLIVLMVKACT